MHTFLWAWPCQCQSFPRRTSNAPSVYIWLTSRPWNNPPWEGWGRIMWFYIAPYIAPKNLLVRKIYTYYIDRRCVHTQLVSRVWLSATPWTVACQAPLSMEFSRQEYWSGLPFSIPGDLSDPGIKLKSPALAGGFFTTMPPGKPHYICI